MRTAQGELIFSVNGESKGIAATGIAKPIWAVVSLYGKCTQVSSISTNELGGSCATVATAAAAVAMASANYDIESQIESFIPNFHETISTTSVSALNSLIGERHTDEYMLSGKQMNKNIIHCKCE